ncbi:MAG TPA: hypothetical protein PKY71_07250 [Smithellaceae bacterium]|jgi:hypothetical protein|nr:MAG: hypothetical protein BWX55_00062 [Deltaproteobacteria bacterium ADurb.Bin022]HPL97324.1 hypothetical protein [Smithellaceae bacterium]
MKTGLDDYLNTHSAEDLEALPETEVTDEAIAQHGTKQPYYISEDGSTYRWKDTKEGRYRVKLANFSAIIKEETREDDGQDVTHCYKLRGLADKRFFPDIEVPAVQFASMNWIARWGTEAIIEPGSTNKDCMRHAIQILSQNRTKKNVCFTHTGWRYEGGLWFYLTSSGAIGKEGVNVRLSRENLRYRLPLAPEREKEAIAASLSFLQIGKKEITYPLFAVTYLSPLISLLNPQPNFVSYVYGQTGTFKTTVSLLQLSHFGDFQSIANLSNFDDTGNSIEKKGFILKDVLHVLDDYHPSFRRQDAQVKESLAQRLIRSYSNRTARGRLNADTSDKGRHEPRGFLQITGEELVSLSSTQARTLVVEIEPGDIDKDKLSAIQGKMDLLPHAMTSFLLWVRDHIPDIQAGFPERFRELREVATKATGEGIHRKLPEQTAFLLYALELVGQWLIDKGINSKAEAEAFIGEAFEVFNSLTDRQAQRIAEDDPVKKFFDILSALVISNNARLDHIHQPGTSRGGGEVIGYFDTEFVYLIPTPTWHAISRYSMQEGGHFPYKQRSLYKLLRTRGILIPYKTENTTPVKINGTLHRVIKIYGTYLNLDVTPVTEG